MLIVTFLSLMTLSSFSQFYEYGQDAGSLRWSQFHTPHYRVIYPRNLDSVAMAFASKLEYFYPYQAEVLDHQHSKMPVIIHNEASFSNGVFVWAPKRLEIFTNPNPNGYPADWLTQLALHEGRHAFQIDKLNQGITKFLTYLGGEQAAGAMAAFLPLWYLEGDAVDAETRLSLTGRGRQPDFEMELKAQLLEQERIYSYTKATLGSYKHHIPNHYQLGYLMVRYGRRMHGDKLWIDFQNNAARKPFLIAPTFFALRKNGAGSKIRLYKDALEHYRTHWDSLGTWRLVTEFHRWSKEPKSAYTSYKYPHFISSNLLFAYKEGIDQIPEFVMLGKNGEEKRIHLPGYLNSGRVSMTGDVIVWDEFVPSTRWSNRNFSVIKSLKIGSGQVKQLGKRTRYYAPAVSKNAAQIAAIEHETDYKFNLVIMDMEGKLLHKVPSPNNFFIQHPAWMENDSGVVVTLTNDDGKYLYAWSRETGDWKQLYYAGVDNIANPVVYDHRVYFEATFSGIDNIYCLDLNNSEAYQVSSSKFGGFQPQISPDGKMLVLSDYTSKGYAIKSSEIIESTWKRMEEVRDRTEQLSYEPSDKEKQIVSDKMHTEAETYSVKPYRKVFHPFKFHSWLPLYFDYLDPNLAFTPGDLPASLGFSLLSQNHLSTVVSQFSYEYKDGYHFAHTGIQLNGRFPVLNLYADYGGLPDVLNPLEGDSLELKPNNLKLNAQLFVPFRLNTGSFITFVQPRLNYAYRADYQYYDDSQEYAPGAHYVLYDMHLTSYLRMGKRDILPRVGFSATGGMAHALFNHQLFGTEITSRFTLYLPGFLKHQTIKAGYDYYKQNPVSVSKPNFRYLIAPPRGMDNVYGLSLNKITLDYVFPIIYPDLNIEGLFYLTRIRAALWTDYMSGSDVIVLKPRPHYEDKSYMTYGIELLADYHFLRIAFPFTTGARMAYLPHEERFVFELIYSVDIN